MHQHPSLNACCLGRSRSTPPSAIAMQEKCTQHQGSRVQYGFMHAHQFILLRQELLSPSLVAEAVEVAYNPDNSSNGHSWPCTSYSHSNLLGSYSLWLCKVQLRHMQNNLHWRASSIECTCTYSSIQKSYLRRFCHINVYSTRLHAGSR